MWTNLHGVANSRWFYVEYVFGRSRNNMGCINYKESDSVYIESDENVLRFWYYVTTWKFVSND